MAVVVGMVRREIRGHGSRFVGGVGPRAVLGFIARGAWSCRVRRHPVGRHALAAIVGVAIDAGFDWGGVSAKWTRKRRSGSRAGKLTLQSGRVQAHLVDWRHGHGSVVMAVHVNGMAALNSRRRGRGRRCEPVDRGCSRHGAMARLCWAARVDGLEFAVLVEFVARHALFLARLARVAANLATSTGCFSGEGVSVGISSFGKGRSRDGGAGRRRAGLLQAAGARWYPRVFFFPLSEDLTMVESSEAWSILMFG